jgi:hypothetical protein
LTAQKDTNQNKHKESDGPGLPRNGCPKKHIKIGLETGREARSRHVHVIGIGRAVPLMLIALLTPYQRTKPQGKNECRTGWNDISPPLLQEGRYAWHRLQGMNHARARTHRALAESNAASASGDVLHRRGVPRRAKKAKFNALLKEFPRRRQF